MNGPLAEQIGDIHRRMHEIAKEEGRPDFDVMTATDVDLDTVACRCDMERRPYESDDSLRDRVIEELRKRTRR